MACNLRAVDFLNRTEPDKKGRPVHINAENLGYYTGATVATIDKMNSETKTEGDIFKAISKASVSAGLSWSPAGAKAAGAVASGIIEITIGQVGDDIAASRTEVADALFDLAIPKSANGKAEPFEGGNSFRSYFNLVTGRK